MDTFKDALPTKEVTLKALQDAGISLTVVGKTVDKKDFDPLVNGTNGLYLDIDKNFADLLNVQFANKVVETVQKGRVFKVQTDKYELISKTHRVAKAKPQTLAPKRLQNRPYSHLLKTSLPKPQSISHQQLFLKKKQVFQIQEARPQLP